MIFSQTEVTIMIRKQLINESVEVKMYKYRLVQITRAERCARVANHFSVTGDCVCVFAVQGCSRSLTSAHIEIPYGAIQTICYA